MGQPLPKDDFDQFAPRRLEDRGPQSAPARPDWLTHAKQGELHGPDPALLGRAAAGDSWEKAVERAAHADEMLDDEPGTRGFGAAKRTSRASGFPAWQPLLERVSSPPVLLVAVVAIALIAVLMFRPREEMTTSSSAIRHHPERFDGRPVKVKGRIGEVFAVGGGYAFHLHQGRENIVVFTRSRVPVRREEVTISGSISNGILDGKSRQALFETPN